MPDWLADLMPNAAAPTAVPAKPLEVPQPLVPQVTADKEALLKSVAAQTGTQLILRQDTRNFGYSLVLFSGPAQATHQARQRLQERLGLVGTSTVTTMVEFHALTQSTAAYAALSPHVPVISAKHSGTPIRMFAPDVVGMPFRAQIGPGPLATVSMVEQALRRQLREVELDLCGKMGRKVPSELKYAMMCRLIMEGRTCPNRGCIFCHSEDELEIASRCLWENVAKAEEMQTKVEGDQPLVLCLSPTDLRAAGRPSAPRRAAPILTARDLSPRAAPGDFVNRKSALVQPEQDKTPGREQKSGSTSGML